VAAIGRRRRKARVCYPRDRMCRYLRSQFLEMCDDGQRSSPTGVVVVAKKRTNTVGADTRRAASLAIARPHSFIGGRH
jgi:hypothetical protein